MLQLLEHHASFGRGPRAVLACCNTTAADIPCTGRITALQERYSTHLHVIHILTRGVDADSAVNAVAGLLNVEYVRALLPPWLLGPTSSVHLPSASMSTASSTEEGTAAQPSSRSSQWPPQAFWSHDSGPPTITSPMRATRVIVCGPPGFNASARHIIEELGVPRANQIVLE